MAINKVVYGEETLLDVSDDTATADKILSGFTAHDHTGNQVVGTAAIQLGHITTLEELEEIYDSEDGFLLSYDNVTTGTQYVTNTVTVSKGIFVETSVQSGASRWYLELVSGYTNRFYVYTLISNEKQYMYNDTASNANFMGLSTTSKAAFDITCEEPGKFLMKISTKNAWFQHSNSADGMRLYTDHKNASNSLITFTCQVNAIIPYGTLTITENGTYDVYNCAQVIVNI